MTLYGWTGKILEVDLTSGAATTRESAPYLREYVGGRALAAKIAWDEIPRQATPYDPENRVIIATGPLTGTLAPTSGRTIMSSLSPRTYPLPWYTHSTLGGWFGAELKYAGYDALILRGQAAAPVYLEIQDGAVKLQDASALWGLDARETPTEPQATLRRARANPGHRPGGGEPRTLCHRTTLRR